MTRNSPRGSAPAGPSDGSSASGPTPSQGRRRKRYFVMMAVCVVLFLLAGTVVYRFSFPIAAGMTVVAMAIPPFAAIVANRREKGDRWWDE
ncbi:DUF3099 domain-containing protein [Streptomyces sp. SID3343]|uniref:DUF3099 domain-containing protein n=1 Tax=Streptomyces sp. SID3343 TaxID=2690260 RepID=UPI0013699F33|nr:DUF3099 domain-containing protein [Streptomyces sp. SID3343]